MEDFSLEELSEKQLLRIAKYYKINIDKSKPILEQVKEQLKVNPDGSIVKKEHNKTGGARSVFYKVI
jgi:hypothetical protein